MAVLIDTTARESEILALKLQEEELRLQQDALLAQRIALAYACRSNDDRDDDVEFVMEVSAPAAAEEETAQLELVEKQLSEVQNKRSRLAVEDLQEVYRYQERVARSSRIVAESLEAQERWRLQVAQHDAAFARRLDNIDEDDWEEFGDDIEEPLNLPPPREVPRVRDEPVPAAVLRAAAELTACAGGGGSSSSRSASGALQSTTRPTTKYPTSRPSSRSSQPQPQQQQPASGSSRPLTAPMGSRQGASGSGAGASSNRTTLQQPPTTVKAHQGPSAAAAAAKASATGPNGASKAAAATAVGFKAGASSTKAGAAGPSAATIECLICFDRFPETQVTCAGADAASSSSSSAGCGHYLCTGCVTEYMRAAVRDGKYPIGCPMAMAGGRAGGGGGRAAPGGAGQQQRGCQLKFSRESVLAALARHPMELQAFGLLEVEQTIDQSMRIYCPHKSCSTLLVRPDPEEVPKDTPISCPACQRMFCVNCLIPGWHHGYTCAAFQALPAHLRSAEDAAVLQLSERQQWKRCPQCKLVVERSEGCNHMLCRCGANFCYACGKPYKDTKPTEENVHGTPACGCPLFHVPEEPEGDVREQRQAGDGGGGGAAAYGGGGGYYFDNRYAAAAPAPWRGGRVVKRRRCRFSGSINNCPYGRKCWYWHEEDDGPL